MAYTDAIVRASPDSVAYALREGIEGGIGDYIDQMQAAYPDSLVIDASDLTFFDTASTVDRPEKMSLEIVPTHSRYETYEGTERIWEHFFVCRFTLNTAEGRGSEQVNENYDKIAQRLCWAVALYLQGDSSVGGSVIHAEAVHMTYPPVFHNRQVADISGAEESIQPRRTKTKGRNASVLVSVQVDDPNN